MSVSARLKQYGAFRAIGVSMGQLSKMIVAEAFTYTIIGGVVGTVLGLFCNKLLFGMLISYRSGGCLDSSITRGSCYSVDCRKLCNSGCAWANQENTQYVHC